MTEFMYDIHSGLIAVVLFISMALAIEAGFRLGLRAQPSETDASKAHINAIQSSILGILALLLGFTFSLSLQRFDSRSDAMVNESNAMGTAYLRAQLLPPALRGEVQAQLRQYVDLRVQASHISVVDRQARAKLVASIGQAQKTLWAYARQAADLDTNTVRTGLFIQALNDLIDSFGKHDAVLNRHVPEVVLLLLYGTFLMAGAIVGFSSGVAGHRPSLVSYIMVALIVVLVFIIIDLDRPRRGLIEVSNQSLLDLQTYIAGDQAGLH